MMCKLSQWSHHEAVRADLAPTSATWPLYKQIAKDLDGEGRCMVCMEVSAVASVRRQVVRPFWVSATDFVTRPHNIWAT